MLYLPTIFILPNYHLYVLCFLLGMVLLGIRKKILHNNIYFENICIIILHLFHFSHTLNLRYLGAVWGVCCKYSLIPHFTPILIFHRVLGLQMLLSCSGTMWVEVECLVRVNTSYEEFWYKNEFDPWLCHQIILLFIKFAAQSIMSVT